jgi:hypothetical protein
VVQEDAGYTKFNGTIQETTEEETVGSSGRHRIRVLSSKILRNSSMNRAEAIPAPLTLFLAWRPGMAEGAKADADAMANSSRALDWYIFPVRYQLFDVSPAGELQRTSRFRLHRHRSGPLRDPPAGWRAPDAAKARRSMRALGAQRSTRPCAGQMACRASDPRLPTGLLCAADLGAL